MCTNLLDQIIEPFAECLTKDAARKIVAFANDPVRFGGEDCLYVTSLAEVNRKKFREIDSDWFTMASG